MDSGANGCNRAKRENGNEDRADHQGQYGRTRISDEFLEPYRIQGLVKKYSDYICNPIKMDMTRSCMKEKPADAGDDYSRVEEYTENETPQFHGS